MSSGHKWKPGDVAIIAIAGRGDVVAMYMDGDDWETPYAEADGQTTYKARRVTVIRPLVVIDPEDPEQLARLGKAMRASGCRWSTDTQTALRSLVAPPKPDEPTGRYAVVVDADRVEWIRTREGYWAWVEYEGFVPQVHSRRWSEVDAVKVLSEGVTQ